jgi:hypothetical protein
MRVGTFGNKLSAFVATASSLLPTLLWLTCFYTFELITQYFKGFSLDLYAPLKLANLVSF